ncbi:hypothetical protein LTR78_006244 [Recurvomyces mirabilis]|uniref:Sugar phosphate transporter domain-containing protein n=1 Tax=Recurvomyces mirabilis TaxID=574656 RepID=A0AAE0WLS8_9PEZI|nr:hypothetical protein LTR78_006244 [Recurvomyces mirabilis]KAK5152085.1 hypothetical protein LTS14_008860 [Recurvomyces mirabilis]
MSNFIYPPLDAEKLDHATFLPEYNTPAMDHSRRNMNDAADIEKQSTGNTTDNNVPLESTYSLLRKVAFLAAYFFLNLALTISNKAILGKAKYPWLLTTMHASITSFGCFMLLGSGHMKARRLSRQESLTVVAFSGLFALNIAMSNVSLAAVSIPLHQIMRSTCPVVTIAIYWLVYKRSYSKETYLSMIPLILGVGVATAGDYYCTLGGFLLTATGVVLAAIKTIATNRLVSNFSPMEVLLYMSPLAAAQCVVYAFAAGEVQRVRLDMAAGTYRTSEWKFFLGLLMNASTAFALNIVSFQTNKVAGALTISVCGNVKQALTIMLGVVLFSVPMGRMNIVGTLITVVGAAWFSKVELDNKKIRSTK